MNDTTELRMPHVTRKHASRRIVMEWRTEPLDNADGEAYAELSVMHHQGSRCFGASLNTVRKARSAGGLPMTQFMPFDAVRILQEPVTRYSVKGLEAFAAKALAAVAAQLDNPKVAAILPTECR